MNSSAKANAEIAKNDKGENPTNGSSQSISLTANLVYELWRDAKIFGAITPENKIKLTNTVSEHTATFKRALTTNVKIAFGTDTFELPGTNAEELELMMRYGMKVPDALRSATSTAAALLEVSDSTGTIEAGKSADIIAFRGDPVADIRLLQHVLFVMKEGKVFKQEE